MQLKFEARCNNCAWRPRFTTQEIAQQSLEVHTEILQPTHSARLVQMPVSDAVFACGHSNTGNMEHPASYYRDCPVCRWWYCDDCNYDSHTCRGCGEEGGHVKMIEHWKVDCTA